jgi:hypothetical protein
MMNERIRELALRSGLNASYGSDREGLRDFDYEKFAELIVRECANHCDLLLDHKMSSEWSRGTHDCSKAIKKDFGVES